MHLEHPREVRVLLKAVVRVLEPHNECSHHQVPRAAHQVLALAQFGLGILRGTSLVENI